MPAQCKMAVCSSFGNRTKERGHEPGNLSGRVAAQTRGTARWAGGEAAAVDDGEQLRASGRHGRSGCRQQRGSHSAEAETDGRQDPAGDRCGPPPHRRRNLRSVPRLRRADRRGAAHRHSVDPLLYCLQRKAGVVANRRTDDDMHKDELRQLLTDFAAERVAILQRHEASARVVSHYDFNNTYQYVIAREETHVSWLQNALAEFGIVLPAPASALPVPDAPKGKKLQPAAFTPILTEDA